MSDRARQFMPFNALKGFNEAIKERERLKVQKKELNDDDLEELNKIIYKIKKGMMVSIIFYDNGEYIKKTGLVSSINLTEKSIDIVKQRIEFKAIKEIIIK